MKKYYWFRAKNYGWGWYPCSWQGWLVLVVYVGYLLFRSKVVKDMFDTSSSFVFRYSFETIFATVILIIICFITGEKPEWRWGKKRKK